MARTQSNADESEEQRGITEISGRAACSGSTTEGEKMPPGSGQEPDTSTADQHPTNEADAETVHTTDEWALVVRANGRVEARTHWPNGDPKTYTIASTDEAPEPSATYRYGKTIEGVLARYAHETRFERDPNDGEHGAALRDGIIEALCTLAPTTFPDGSDGQPVGIVHVNAPTGPSTYVVSEDGTDTGTYATFYPFENANEEKCRERGEVDDTLL